MQSFNPYLTFNGTARAALDHYAAILGGTVTFVQTFGEMPEGAMPPMGDELKSRIAHGRVQFAAGMLMVSDTFDPTEDVTYSGFTLQTEWPDTARAQEVFDQLAEGGSVVMPFAPTSWADGFGICRDKFGVGWMVNVEPAGG